MKLHRTSGSLLLTSRSNALIASTTSSPDEQVGGLGLAQVAHEPRGAAPLVELDDVAVQRPALERERHDQDDERDRDAADRLWRLDLLEALADREHAAAEEQQQRDDE